MGVGPHRSAGDPRSSSLRGEDTARDCGHAERAGIATARGGNRAAQAVANILRRAAYTRRLPRAFALYVLIMPRHGAIILSDVRQSSLELATACSNRSRRRATFKAFLPIDLVSASDGFPGLVFTGNPVDLDGTTG